MDSQEVLQPEEPDTYELSEEEAEPDYSAEETNRKDGSA